jgi:phosphoenolpyruvate-protein kinase (PTS system EI component)
VKAAIRDLDVYQCASLAKQALTMASANDVRKLVLAADSESAG